MNIGQEEMKGCSIKKKVLLRVLMSGPRNMIGNCHSDDLHSLIVEVQKECCQKFYKDTLRGIVYILTKEVRVN